MVPDTVQTGVVPDVKLTVRLELAVAESVSGEADSEALASGAKLIVCEPLLTVTVTVAGAEVPPGPVAV
jgi:hypothetical protein